MPKKYGISFWLWTPMLLFSGVGGLAESSPSFRNDVLPVMTKMGCNSGSCHGASTGKKGFSRKFPVQAGQTETFEGTIDKYLKFETDPDEITVEVAVEVYRPWWE